MISISSMAVVLFAMAEPAPSGTAYITKLQHEHPDGLLSTAHQAYAGPQSHRLLQSSGGGTNGSEDDNGGGATAAYGGRGLPPLPGRRSGPSPEASEPGSMQTPHGACVRTGAYSKSAYDQAFWSVAASHS